MKVCNENTSFNIIDKGILKTLPRVVCLGFKLGKNRRTEKRIVVIDL